MVSELLSAYLKVAGDCSALFASLEKTLPSVAELGLSSFATPESFQAFSIWLDQAHETLRVMAAGTLKVLVGTAAIDLENEAVSTLFAKVVAGGHALPEDLAATTRYRTAFRQYILEKAKHHVTTKFATVAVVASTLMTPSSDFQKVVTCVNPNVNSDSFMPLHTWSKNFLEHFSIAVSDWSFAVSVKLTSQKTLSAKFAALLVAPILSKVAVDFKLAQGRKKCDAVPEVPAGATEDMFEESEIQKWESEFQKWKVGNIECITKQCELIAKASAGAEHLNSILSLCVDSMGSSSAAPVSAPSSSSAESHSDIKSKVSTFADTFAEEIEKCRTELVEEVNTFMVSVGSAIVHKFAGFSTLEELFTKSPTLPQDEKEQQNLFDMCTGGVAQKILTEWKWAREQVSWKLVEQSTGVLIPLTPAEDWVRVGKVAADMTCCVTLYRQLRANEDRMKLVSRGVRLARLKGPPMVPHACVISQIASTLKLPSNGDWDAFLAAFKEAEGPEGATVPAAPVAKPSAEAAGPSQAKKARVA